MQVYRWDELWLWTETPEYIGWPLPKPTQAPEAALTATAVHNPRAGNSCQQSTPKARASARSGAQEPAAALAPEAAAATVLCAGTGHCPHLLGSLCNLTLLRITAQDRLLCGNMGTASDDSNISRALDRAGTPHPPQLCLPCPPPLPSPNEQVSPNEPLPSPCLVWGGNRHQKVSYKQTQGQDQRRRECPPAATGAAD